MKKILLLITCLYTTFAYTQNINFEIQADGTFKNSEDGKDFAVVNRENSSKEDLYSEVLIALTRLYNSPKDVISKVENEVITVNDISPDCVILKGMMGIKVYFSIQYILQFQFKDSKIRVDAPVISRLFTDNAPDIKPFEGWLNTQSVFKKGKPNPKKQNTIDDFNNTLNDLINSIVSKRQTNEDW